MDQEINTRGGLIDRFTDIHFSGNVNECLTLYEIINESLEALGSSSSNSTEALPYSEIKLNIKIILYTRLNYVGLSISKVDMDNLIQYGGGGEAVTGIFYVLDILSINQIPCTVTYDVPRATYILLYGLYTQEIDATFNIVTSFTYSGTIREVYINLEFMYLYKDEMLDSATIQEFLSAIDPTKVGYMLVNNVFTEFRCSFEYGDTTLLKIKFLGSTNYFIIDTFDSRVHLINR